MFSGMNMNRSVIVGGVTYMATANDWAANVFNDVGGTAGLPFQAFIGGCAGDLVYSIVFSGSKVDSMQGKLKGAMYTGLGAMIGGSIATVLAGGQSAPIGAAIGSIYFNFGGEGGVFTGAY